MREISYLQALNEALHEEMARDMDVFIMGEDIGLGKGTLGVTEGLRHEFGPERVRNTPISEQALVGAALGAALTGCRPIVELMFIDLLGVCMDQVANQVAKVTYMSGGKARPALVIRTQEGVGLGLAAQHSQSLEAWLVHIPGLIVVAPSTPFDAKGLLKTAVRDDNPVFFIEHKLLYSLKGPVPEEEYLVPLGVADIKRKGRDVTIVATSHQVQYALAAATTLALEGTEAEVIDPRTLNPLDVETIAESVRRTHRLVVVNEGCRTGGYASEVAATLGEHVFEYLDAPIMRVAAKDAPIPANLQLEREVVPKEEDILTTVRQMVGSSGW
ncbi:MAG: alpha-ketoacid dehydrogenase subunit beta [Chloroflexi bacterium]|nr:alpha-ketoacid dehydrogenase subunit beta [Chloroflexota bacterium]